jgi:peptidyl-prolyl cis-trans isomerase D
MLQAIRNRAGSAAVKILFGLLIVTFGIWGIGDIFRQGGSSETTVIKVGDRKIQADALQQEFREQLERLRQTLGSTIDATQAKALGVLDRTIDNMVARQLIDLEAERLNLALGDKAVLDAIHATPAFQGPDGKFDRRVYSLTLANARLSEPQYEAQLRGDMLRAQLAEALTGGVVAPAILADPLYRMRNEKRVAELAFIPAEKAGDVGEPSEQDLAELYERSLDHFRTPEYRGFTALLLTPETVAGQIEIPEDKIRAEYDARRSELEKPEKRALRQILVDSEEKAKAVEAALAAGKSFEDAAKEVAGLDAGALSLGTVTRNDLPPELADAVFALEPNKPSEPVKTGFGWHILEVTSIEPGGVPPYEAVRDDLRKRLVHDQAADRLYEMANQIEDALAGGASVDEVAAKFGLKPIKIAASDPDGQTPKGEEVKLPAAEAEVLRTVFETPQGQASRVIESKDGGTFYLVQVTQVTPAGTKQRTEVGGQLREMWLAQKRDAAVEKQAKELAAKIGEGKSLAEVAKENGLETKTSEPFLRNAQGASGLPGGLVGAVFEAKLHEAVTAAGPGGWYVAQVKSVERPDPSADKTALDQLERQLGAQIRSDLVSEYQRGLRSRFPVEIHQQEIDRFL